MTELEIRESVLRALGDIAPEADLTRLKPDVSFRDQLDVDSMDFLNFVIALDQQLHIAIPEASYTRMVTLDGAVDLLMSLAAEQKLDQTAGPPRIA